MTYTTQKPVRDCLAWRQMGAGNNARTYYVADFTPAGPGDRYGYTTDPKQALLMSEFSAKRFQSYMRACADVGYYGKGWVA